MLFGLFKSGSSSNAHLPEPPQATSSDEPAPIVVHKFDFPEIGLPEYKGKLAFVIDNLFTQADCDRLQQAAETSSPWKAAAIGGDSPDDGYVNTSVRYSSRIILKDAELADWMLEKLRPYITDILTAPAHRWNTYNPNKKVTDGRDESEVVVLSRINERLSFLRYGPGQFFKPHCDTTFATPDRTEISYYTIQVYISGDAHSLKGGSTRFMSQRHRKNGGTSGIFDVDPRVGRVLIFDQVGLWHSGEEVVSGDKISMRTEFMYKRESAEVAAV